MSNALSPSWRSGSAEKRAVGPGSATPRDVGPPMTANPSWASAASAPLSLLRMAPPLSVRLFRVSNTESYGPSSFASV